LWMVHAKDRSQGGTESHYLTGVRMNFTRAGYLRLEYARGHETFAGQRFETGKWMATGGVPMTRWLNIGGSAETGPSPYYELLFQGDRRSAGVRLGLQPSARLYSNTSYSFSDFTNRATGLETYRVHILNTRNTYQFSPRFFARAVVQFDSLRERVLADYLASYELTPGTVVHAGYGSLYGRETIDTYHATARAFFFKASYRAAF
jgi:hypothetical protein